MKYILIIKCDEHENRENDYEYEDNRYTLNSIFGLFKTIDKKDKRWNVCHNPKLAKILSSLYESLK